MMSDEVERVDLCQPCQFSQRDVYFKKLALKNWLQNAALEVIKT